MGVFEFESGGKVFEVEAPDSNAAMSAFRQISGQPAPVSEFAAGAISGIPGEISKEAGAAWEKMKKPFSEEAVTSGALGGLMNTGAALTAIPQMLMSPLTGAARSIGGRGLATASHLAGSVINPEVAARDNPQQMYEELAPQVDKALGGVAPSRGGLATMRGPAMPPREVAKVPVPTRDKLIEKAGDGYKAADSAATGDFSPDIMSALSSNTKQILNPKRERIAPQAYGLVDDLAKDSTFADIRVTRELLGEVAQSVDRKERRAATIAIKEIDGFLARNEPLAAHIFTEANANYSAGRRLEQLEQSDRIGGLRTGRAGYGGNEINARRQVISPIVEKYIKGNKNGFSPDEMAALEKFVVGTKGINAARMIGQLAPSRGGFNAGGGVLPIVTGGATLIAGSGLNKLGALMTRNQYQSIMDKVAKRSPAYTEALSKATDKFLTAHSSFEAQPTPAKLASLVSAARALSSGLRFDGVSVSSGELLKRLQAPMQSAAEDQEP